MTWTKLHYGTIVATAMLLGGGIVYYNHLDRPVGYTKTAERIVTLWEAILEHSAAIAPWPLTTNTSTSAGWDMATNITDARNWNYNGYSSIPLLAFTNPRKAMDESLDQVKALLPHFVDRVDGTNVTMLTVTGVFSRLNIGDGTNQWTIGYDTNNNPVYGESIGYTLCTTTLDEAWAVLNACTTTVRTAQWVAGQKWQWGTNHTWTYDPDVVTNETVLKTDPPPPWWTDANGDPIETEAGVPATFQVSELNYAPDGVLAVHAQELIAFGLMSAAAGDAIRTTEPNPLYWLYQPRFSADEVDGAVRVDSTGAVYIANLAAGVTADVSIVWSATGKWVNCSSLYGVITNAFYECNTSAYSFACTGVSTGWAGIGYVTNLKWKVADFFDWSGENAPFVVTNTYWNDPSANSVGYSVLPPPSMLGECDATLHMAIVNWTFRYK